ncbi:cyclase family protein [Microbacterium sp. NPDC089695]|uniref:cyclase family protein n=1 Tax=Microbacterium sp. NPDC089695 TaxID=3364198 RepID=UPI0037F69393
MNADDLRALAARVSNAGRWGADDQRGTLNLVTDAVRLAALTEVRDGSVHSIAREIVVDGGDAAALRLLPGDDIDRTLRDELVIAPHGFAMTHADAVGHCWFDGVMYNDRPAGSTITDRGLEANGLGAQQDGVVTRGVLLDVARARGVEALAPGEAVHPADLDAAVRLAGTEVRPGDAVFVRVGTGTAADPVTGPDGRIVRAGLAADCLSWLRGHDVAVYSGDCVDVFPSPVAEYPDYFHQIALGRIGLAFLDGPDVELLAELCRARRRATFLLMYAPLRVPRATGSAVNPVVMF